MAIEQSRSRWEGTEPIGFTAYMARELNVAVLVDEISNEAVQAYQRRCDLLATLIGVKQAKSNGAIRRAVVVRERN